MSRGIGALKQGEGHLNTVRALITIDTKQAKGMNMWALIKGGGTYE